MAQITLYPKPGLNILDPATGRTVDPEGIIVEDTELFWVRLVNDGDMSSTPPAKAAAAPAPKAPPAPPAQASEA